MGISESGRNARLDCRTSSARRLTVEVVRRCARWEGRITDNVIVGAAEAAFAAGGRIAGPAELSLLLSDDAEIKRLNETWRGKDEPTNVLSFPLNGAPPVDGSQPLGDVAIAYETVAGEAQGRGISVGQHTVHMVVHGVLHLIGYDHMSDEDAQSMEALEVQVLADLGLPDPYASEIVTTGNPR